MVICGEPSEATQLPDPTPSDSWKTPSWGRLALALAIAIASDVVSLLTSWNVGHPISVGVDVVTAGLLWWVLGRHPALLVVFVAEAIPVVGMIPLWTMIVAVIAVTGRLPSGMGKRAATQQLPPSAPPPPTDSQAP
ncbi:MAG: hypothetical protein EXS01_03370 [Phycisphaerales bacterium]|nr:hypothetical protein [Phycisphaerales bacterium]